MRPTSPPAASDRIASRYRYDLDESEVFDTCETFVATHHLRGRFHCVRTDSESALAQVARTIECQVFDREFGNDAGEMAEEYRPYERNSVSFVVLDVRSRRPAGVMRVVCASTPDDRLKSVEDLGPAVGFSTDDYLAFLGERDLTSTMDVATLGILPEYRGSASGSYRVSGLLYRALVVYATANAKYLVTILDRRARRSLQYIGVPLIDVLDEPFDYLGSPESHAICMAQSSIDEWRERQSARHMMSAFLRPVGRSTVRTRVTEFVVAYFARGITHGMGTDRHITL